MFSFVAHCVIGEIICRCVFLALQDQMFLILSFSAMLPPSPSKTIRMISEACSCFYGKQMVDLTLYCHTTERRCLVFIIWIHFSTSVIIISDWDKEIGTLTESLLEHSQEKTSLISLKITGWSWHQQLRDSSSIFFKLFLHYLINAVKRTKTCGFPSVWLYHPFDLGLIGCTLASGTTDTTN